MNELINKYRYDKLTPEELIELRKRVNQATDSEMEQFVSDSWFSNDIDSAIIDDEPIDRVKKNISGFIKTKRTRSKLIRLSQIAAAILLPIFILGSVYFYRENSSIMSEEMFINTGKGERASITLPDGSVVSLNSDSRLGYLPRNYNKKVREITFSGEGYFQVFHNEETPFFINAKGLQVKVLGTTFNLSVRENEDTAELSLEEGKVVLVSMRNKKTATLSKNQKAILDHHTGEITVVTDENILDVSAWRRGDMIFRNTDLSQIISMLEENYNISITINCKQYLNDQFTGILPTNNLNEALEILEYSYGVKAIIRGKEVIINAN